MEGQIKTITEERIDDQGRKVIVTRNIRMRLVQEKVSPAVAERRTWKKFGAAEGLKPGPDLASTILGEPVFLKLSHAQDIDKELVNKATVATNIKGVTCRFCEGPHWSATCPYKETFMDNAQPKKTGEEDEKKSGKYVPPSQRAREAAAAEAAAQGIAPGDQDSTNTIRVSNLSDMVTDADLRDLCGRIGPLSRCFVAKDMMSGRCKGYAFVTYHSMADAEKAIAKLNGHGYGNMVLSVTRAKAQAPK